MNTENYFIVLCIHCYSWPVTNGIELNESDIIEKKEGRVKKLDELLKAAKDKFGICVLGKLYNILWLFVMWYVMWRG